ncbi:MAG: sensor histidine kinase KdpD, partial [Thermoleophilia bacterium]|nr:sensor histidine kinase KdpD [Thermoleophilia bacterium]
MTDHRPDPDALLRRVQAEEARKTRGALKIFFGYAAGVGKTYAMLEAARRAAEAGRGVVVGYVEPHGRPETEALLAGLPAIPPRLVDYRGVTLREFDVDAALARRPDLILVDELAHTNAEGCRHTKRWQDVEELLDAGINVWTTLNVQHLESLNDLIGGVTGVTVRETVPDGVFEQADDLELVDITPEELMDRLRAGKVYLPEQAQRALGGFFQKPNLTALREFSLRQAARRVQTDVESARRQRSATEPWATADRVLVCVGPSPSTPRVIRTAKRLAQALDAPWLAAAVERTG